MILIVKDVYRNIWSLDTKIKIADLLNASYAWDETETNNKTNLMNVMVLFHT